MRLNRTRNQRRRPTANHASVEGEENDDPSPARLVASGKERNKNVDSDFPLCNVFGGTA